MEDGSNLNDVTHVSEWMDFPTMLIFMFAVLVPLLFSSRSLSRVE